jgi:hypothetical protein
MNEPRNEQGGPGELRRFTAFPRRARREIELPVLDGPFTETKEVVRGCADAWPKGRR